MIDILFYIVDICTLRMPCIPFCLAVERMFSIMFAALRYVWVDLCYRWLERHLCPECENTHTWQEENTLSHAFFWKNIKNDMQNNWISSWNELVIGWWYDICARKQSQAVNTAKTQLEYDASFIVDHKIFKIWHRVKEFGSFYISILIRYFQVQVTWYKKEWNKNKRHGLTLDSIVLGQRGDLYLHVERVISVTFAFIIVIAHFNSAFNSACSVKIHLRIKIIHILRKGHKLYFCNYIMRSKFTKSISIIHQFVSTQSDVSSTIMQTNLDHTLTSKAKSDMQHFKACQGKKIWFDFQLLKMLFRNFKFESSALLFSIDTTWHMAREPADTHVGVARGCQTVGGCNSHSASCWDCGLFPGFIIKVSNISQ